MKAVPEGTQERHSRFKILRLRKYNPLTHIHDSNYSHSPSKPMEYDQRRQRREPEDCTECGNGVEGGDASTGRAERKQLLPWLLFGVTAAATLSLGINIGRGVYSSGITTPSSAERGTAAAGTSARLGVHQFRAIADDHRSHYPERTTATPYLSADENGPSKASKQHVRRGSIRQPSDAVPDAADLEGAVVGFDGSRSPPEPPQPDLALEPPLAGSQVGSTAMHDSGWVTIAEGGNAPVARAGVDASLQKEGEYDEMTEDEAEKALVMRLLSSISSAPPSLAAAHGHAATGNRESWAVTRTGSGSGSAPGRGSIPDYGTGMRSVDEMRDLKAKRFGPRPAMGVLKMDSATGEFDQHSVDDALSGQADQQSVVEQPPMSQVVGNSSARCFDDPREPDVHRCRANIYFFGVSKCGEFSAFFFFFFSCLLVGGGGRGGEVGSCVRPRRTVTICLRSYTLRASNNWHICGAGGGGSGREEVLRTLLLLSIISRILKFLSK